MTINTRAISAAERQDAMPEGTTRTRAGRMAIAATLVASAVLLSACGNSQLTTGSIPDDYRTRHPIVLSEGEYTLDLPISAGDTRLPNSLRDTIRGFAQNYASSPAGLIQVQVPQGSYNAAAASRLSGEIRRTLVNAGVKPQSIMMMSYAASPQGDAAPVRLSYVTTKAMTSQCGEWPEDLSNNTVPNKNWYNFGCASQNNLAAQVANPVDLVAPRGMTPIDASQRAGVIETYRTGATATE